MLGNTSLKDLVFAFSGMFGNGHMWPGIFLYLNETQESCGKE